MNKWSRRKFFGTSLKGTAGLFTISILPLGLAACNKSDTEVSLKSGHVKMRFSL